MKKTFITVALLVFTAFTYAQQGDQQPNDDQLQQQAPRETQRAVERSAKVEAVKEKSNAEVEAEKTSKDKGQTQNQTKAQPVGINPDENTATQKKLKTTK